MNINGIIEHLHGSFCTENFHKVFGVKLIYGSQLLNQALPLCICKTILRLGGFCLFRSAGGSGLRLIRSLLDQGLDVI